MKFLEHTKLTVCNTIRELIISQCDIQVVVNARLSDIVLSSIDDWKTTPWNEINVDQMETSCKKFAYDIRGLDKEMRSWDVFTGAPHAHDVIRVSVDMLLLIITITPPLNIELYVMNASHPRRC